MSLPDAVPSQRSAGDHRDGGRHTGPLLRVVDDRPARPEVDDLAGCVVRARRGDPAAVEQLLSGLRPELTRFCRSRLGEGSACLSVDDVVQEVCLALVHALPVYEDRGRPFRAFAFRVAAHKVADAQRARRRDRSHATGEVPDRADPADGPELQALARERSSHAYALLDVLTRSTASCSCSAWCPDSRRPRPVGCSTCQPGPSGSPSTAR